VLLPLGLWLSSAGLGLWLERRQEWLWSSLAVLAAVVLVLWLVLRPAFLYPRFFIFLVPACAYLMAAAIARWWVLAPVVALGAAAVPATQDASGVLPGCRSREVSGRCRHTCPEASSGGPGRRAHACGRSASRRPPRRCPREGSPSGAPRAPFGGAPSK